VLRPGRAGFSGREKVAQVGVLVRGLALARWDLADDRVHDRAVRPLHQVGQARLLPGLPQRDLQGVALPRVAVAARLEPHPHSLVPAEQHPAAVRMQDDGRGREVQGQRPRPWIRLGRGEPAHARHVGGLGLSARLVPGEPPVDHRSMVPRGRAAPEPIFPTSPPRTA
jgi:hypothetical protein